MSVSILPPAQAGNDCTCLISDLAEEVVATSFPDVVGSGRDHAVDRVRSFLADQTDGFMAALVAGKGKDWHEMADLVSESAGLTLARTGDWETEVAESNILVPTESGICLSVDTSRVSASKREFIAQRNCVQDKSIYLRNKLAPTRAPSHAADATHEDALAVAPSQKRPIPAEEDLYHAKVQFFPNETDGPKGASRQWKIKIESSTKPEIGGSNKRATHYVSFPKRRRDAKNRVKRLAKDGVLSAQLAQRFVATSDSLHRGQLIGLVYQHKYGGQRVAKGQSSNKHVYFDQYAVITLSATGDEPESVDLYLDHGEPLHLDKIRPAFTRVSAGEPRDTKAPGWYADYDPTGTVTEVRREKRAKAEARKRERAAVDFSPATELGRLMSDIAGAVAEAKQAPQAERLSALEDKIGRLQEDMQRVLDYLRI